MKKILFYINTLERGGAERVLCNLANQFLEDNYAIAFVTSYRTQNEYNLNKQIKRYNLEESDLSGNVIFRNLKRILKLKKIINQTNPDLIISFLPESIFRVVIATMLKKIPIVISVRNDPEKEYYNVVFKCLAKLLYLKVSWIVFQTEEAQKWFAPKIQKKSSIILNQVDEKFFNILRKKEEYYCAVGRLVKQKNYTMMVKAFSRFVQQYPDEKLYIYGEGILHNELKKLIIQLGMERNIVLQGITDDVPMILANAKALILTSDYEGMPNVLLEAMAVGLPVIATDCPCGGPRMIIENGKTGFLVPVKDVDALTFRLQQLQDNSELRQLIGINAKKSADKYRPGVVFEQWEALVQEILDEE